MAEMLTKVPDLPRIAWGIPFAVNEKIVFIKEDPVSISVQPFKTRWLIFLHTSDIAELERDSGRTL